MPKIWPWQVGSAHHTIRAMPVELNSEQSAVDATPNVLTKSGRHSMLRMRISRCFATKRLRWVFCPCLRMGIGQSPPRIISLSSILVGLPRASGAQCLLRCKQHAAQFDVYRPPALLLDAILSIHCDRHRWCPPRTDNPVRKPPKALGLSGRKAYCSQ